MNTLPPNILDELRTKARQLGFQQLGISNVNLQAHEQHLNDWLDQGFHGEMTYMSRHGNKRSRPFELEPGTLSVISVRMDYFPVAALPIRDVLKNNHLGLISRYATGRDYHKIIRNRLQKLADYLQRLVGPYGYRVFCDSAPVLEKALAEQAGLGWIGKHTNLINRQAGSWFFLGEIYTNLPLRPNSEAAENHCGRCRACIDFCPTQAIIGPYQLDARRCISYLTIELKGTIPLHFRRAIGNHIYGCDDCQLVCPWNRFAKASDETDFNVRHGLDAPDLLDLFSWPEQHFLKIMEGSAIRRIGYMQWLRNIAIALGNASYSADIVKSLASRRNLVDDCVAEHIDWAITEQKAKQLNNTIT